MADEIKKIPLKVWLLGFAWAVLQSSPPVLILIWKWMRHRRGPLDWDLVESVAIGALVPAAVGYWRKYKALISLPPDFQEAKDLAEAARKAAGQQ